MWQTYAYWLMGALSNDPRKLAYFAGFYKGIQSAGAAVVWRMDAVKYSFESLYVHDRLMGSEAECLLIETHFRFGSSWGLCAAGMIFALPVLYWKVQDTELTDADFDDDVLVKKVHELGETKSRHELERTRF